MVDQNYDRILEKIAKIANLDKEEVERRVEAKRARLSGLISKDGAAQVVAAELGISFDNERLKIHELLPGMRKVNTVGKVIRLQPVRSFTTKKGDVGKVANFFIADDTSNIKVVLWDTNHIEMIEGGSVFEGSVVEIANGSMRDNEIHLGSFSEFKLSKEILNDIKAEKIVKEKKISDFKIMDNVVSRAFVVQAFEPRFFYVCPECRKKAVSGPEGFICEEHGKVAADKRALMNFVLDDGSETMRALIFNDNFSKLGISEEDEPEVLSQKRNLIIGKEMVFSGNVKMNKFFNNPEFIIDEIKEVDIDELIKKLEN